MKKQKILSNTAFTIGGALLMNGFLQVVIYPLLHRYMGSEQLGNLLYIMGLAAIVCPSVGQALNTNRLVVRRDAAVSNGDYNRLLLLFGGIGTILSLVIAVVTEGNNSPVQLLMAAVLIMVTAFRYYGDVEYRLNLNYRNYFIYYCILTAGYGIGYLLYLLTGIWYLIFLTGEIAALFYLAVTGSVFGEFWKKSPFFIQAFRRGGFLLFSYLITNLTMNIDRLVLKNQIGSEAVTQYYVVSLIGKTLVLLVAPVNTILISYLTRREENLNRKQFLQFTAAGFGVAAAFFAATQVGTPLFVWLFYRGLFDTVRPIMTIVNLGQVLGLYSVYLFMVVLTFTKETWQVVLQVLHLVLIGILTLLWTKRTGMEGFCRAVLAANAVRVAAVVVLGVFKAENERGQVIEK